VPGKLDGFELGPPPWLYPLPRERFAG
jgi:hypothetical protein